MREHSSSKIGFLVNNSRKKVCLPKFITLFAGTQGERAGKCSQRQPARHGLCFRAFCTAGLFFPAEARAAPVRDGLSAVFLKPRARLPKFSQPAATSSTAQPLAAAVSIGGVLREAHTRARSSGSCGRTHLARMCASELTKRTRLSSAEPVVSPVRAQLHSSLARRASFFLNLTVGVARPLEFSPQQPVQSRPLFLNLTRSCFNLTVSILLDCFLSAR